MEQSTRRAWSRPELIVLMRTGREEAVLTACKHDLTGGPATGNSSCVGDVGCTSQVVS